METSPQGDPQFEVVSVDNLGEVERLRPSTLSLSLNLSSLTSSTLSSLRSPSLTSIDTPGPEDDSGKDNNDYSSFWKHSHCGILLQMMTNLC